ncbi:hypothetical protein HA402_015887 [Bradysia odoriphaga]|nr:hypothetical protein HA402_015887 [Bradysia odoriphaga]
MLYLVVLVNWTNFQTKVAVDCVVINSSNQLTDDPSLLPTADSELNNNQSLERQKRILVFRPLLVYKQQQKEKQEMRDKWKAEQELHHQQQQQYQSNYEQQYYQQYVQNYYNQFPSPNGYYQTYSQPSYGYVEPQNTQQSNYWNAVNEQYYSDPYQQTDDYYHLSSNVVAPNPSQYHDSWTSSVYYYE